MSLYKDLRLKYKNYQLQVALNKANKIFDFTNISYAKKNVLIIDSIIPEYDKDSGSRRLHKIIQILIKNKFGVFLVADKKEYKYKTEYVDHYKKLGVVVYEPSVNLDGKLITRESFILNILKKIDYAWLHRADVFNDYSGIVSKKKSVKLIYDMVDFHYLRLEREWQNSKNEKVKKEAEKYKHIEVENSKKADKVVTISDADKEALKEFYPNEEKMITISNIHQYKNLKQEHLERRSGLFFIGGFSHKPNEDAIAFLYNEIMPLVWKVNKDIKVTIVGSYPTKEILALNSDRFSVLGFVEDISLYFNSSRVFIAPLRFGAGVKGKIGQSLEYGLPVITTDVGAEGFEFGTHASKLIDNTAQGMADKILKLYQDDALWMEVSKASKKVLEPFSVNNIEANVLKILNELTTS
jgi:glycosyltransferase involved in cell wall biosynthesis